MAVQKSFSLIEIGLFKTSARSNSSKIFVRRFFDKEGDGGEFQFKKDIAQNLNVHLR